MEILWKRSFRRVSGIFPELGVTIDDKLNFNLHIDKIYKSASNQLNSLLTLKKCLGLEERKVLVNGFALSNFNYCPLVQMLTTAKPSRKIEAIQKRTLCFMINNYESTYKDLLRKTGKPKMNPRRTRSLCIEIYKALNNSNNEFMKDLFKLRLTKRVQREKCKFNLKIPKSSQVTTYGTRSLSIQGPKVWSSLPYLMKVTENLEIFERAVKFWN